MNKKAIFIALTTSVLIGSSTLAVPVEAGWLDKIGAIAQGIGAIRAQNQNKVDKLQENRIESYGERQYLYSERMQGKNILTCETSKGTPFLLKAYDNYFEILSGDGSSKLYTSESLNVGFGGRYFINEVKASAPDTRLWTIIYDCNGNSRAKYGFWLIGTRKNRLEIYITPTKMKELGMPLPDTGNWSTAKGNHSLYLWAENGVLKMDYAFEFWPPDVSHAEAWWILDKTAEIAWDSQKQAFCFTNIQNVGNMKVDRESAAADRCYWEPMTDEEMEYYKTELQAYREQHTNYVGRVNKSYHDLTGQNLPY